MTDHNSCCACIRCDITRAKAEVERLKRENAIRAELKRRSNEANDRLGIVARIAQERAELKLAIVKQYERNHEKGISYSILFPLGHMAAR